jgi:site-specific recombinase XerD
METQSRNLQKWKSEMVMLDEKTKKRYLFLMNQFLETTGIGTLEELYKLQIKSIESKDYLDRDYVESLVKTHFMWLQKHGGKDGKGIKSQSAMIFVMAIVSFFKSQSKELALNLNYKEFKRTQSIGRRAIQKEQLIQVWDSVSTQNKLRNRAILAFLKDSGLRVSDLSTMDIIDYTEAKVVVDKLGNKFKVFDEKVTEKMGVIAYPHVGYEAIDALDAYLAERKETDESQPLIVNEMGERISANSLTNILSRVCQKVGKNLGAHSLRKTHQTLLVSGGVPEGWVLMLEGKESSTYQRPDDLNLLTDAYVKAYPTIKMFNTVDAKMLESQQEEIRQLKNENKDNRDEINKIYEILLTPVKTDDGWKIPSVQREKIKEILIMQKQTSGDKPIAKNITVHKGGKIEVDDAIE